ncbi:hypothetical protein A6456_35125 [Paraburkholderia tropica]|nr:hypothetical protein A6456_35125 [Paraburkholderia tropica]
MQGLTSSRMNAHAVEIGVKDDRQFRHQLRVIAIYRDHLLNDGARLSSRQGEPASNRNQVARHGRIWIITKEFDLWQSETRQVSVEQDRRGNAEQFRNWQ